MPFDINDLTQDKIFELAKHHPTIARVLGAWEAKVITWEQAMYAIILALLERNTELMRDWLNLSHLVPSIIPAMPPLSASDLSPEKLSQMANLTKVPKLTDRDRDRNRYRSVVFGVDMGNEQDACVRASVTYTENGVFEITSIEQLNENNRDRIESIHLTETTEEGNLQHEVRGYRDDRGGFFATSVSVSSNENTNQSTKLQDKFRRLNNALNQNSDELNRNRNNNDEW